MATRRRPAATSGRASLDRQDNATRAGVFIDDTLIAVIPDGDRNGERTRTRVAAATGVHPDRIVTLGLCNDHPTTAAVDCVHEDGED